MTKLKLKVLDIEIEYEGDENFLETKVLPLLEAIKKSHNEKMKKNLLEAYEGLQQNLSTLESTSANMSRWNEELARKMKEFSEKSMHLYERIKTSVDTQSALFEATKEMQEMQMSFNLQYLNLQNQMQNENRQFTMVSNIMKTKHDTVKNSISNIR